MTKRLTDDKHYSDVAEAVRYKLTSTTEFYPNEMDDAIDTIGAVSNSNAYATNCYADDGMGYIPAFCFVKTVDRFDPVSGAFYDFASQSSSEQRRAQGKIVKLTSTTFMFFYYADDSTTTTLYGAIGTTDGLDLTFGTPVVIDSSVYSISGQGINIALGAVALSQDKVFLAYRKTDSKYNAVVCSVSNNTITVGSAIDTGITTSQTSYPSISVALIGGNPVMAIWHMRADVVSFSVSGTTITAGNVTNLYTYASGSNGFSRLIDIIALDSSRALVVTSRYVYICSISGTTVTVGGNVATGATSVDEVGALLLDDDLAVVVINGSQHSIMTISISGTTPAVDIPLAAMSGTSGMPFPVRIDSSSFIVYHILYYGGYQVYADKYEIAYGGIAPVFQKKTAGPLGGSYLFDVLEIRDNQMIFAGCYSSSGYHMRLVSAEPFSTTARNVVPAQHGDIEGITSDWCSEGTSCPVWRLRPSA